MQFFQKIFKDTSVFFVVTRLPSNQGRSLQDVLTIFFFIHSFMFIVVVKLWKAAFNAVPQFTFRVWWRPGYTFSYFSPNILHSLAICARGVETYFTLSEPKQALELVWITCCNFRIFQNFRVFSLESRDFFELILVTRAIFTLHQHVAPPLLYQVTLSFFESRYRLFWAFWLSATPWT